MNITPAISTPRKAIEGPQALAPAAKDSPEASSNSAPAESFTPQAVGDSRLKAAFHGGIRKGVAWGQVAEKPLGGAAAIGTAALGGLALAFGGAVVGGIVGGGFAPAVSALASKGAWDFVTSSFANVGSAIQIGSTIGAVTGLAGGVMLGKTLGDSVAHTAAFVPGFVTGSVQGFINPGSVPAPDPKDKGEVKHRQELRGAFKTEAKVLGGVGVLSGAIGGFVGGATLTAAGSLVADAASGNFSFNNFIQTVGTQALIGGAVGGVALAAVGGYGGEGIARATQWTYDKTIGKATANQPGIKERIEKKEAELNERQTKLDGQAQELNQKTKDYRAEHQAKSEGLTQKEDELSTNEGKVAVDLTTIDGRIEKNAITAYEAKAAQPDSSLDQAGDHAVIGKRSTLDQWNDKLNGWQGQLNTFRDELKAWEQKLDKKIDLDAAAIFAEERKPIDAHFGGLQKELDAFEVKLNAFETDIERRVAERTQQRISVEKPGVLADLESARNEKASAERDRSSAQSERDTAASRHNSATRQRDAANSRLHSAESDSRSLQNRINDLNNRISRLESELRSM